MNQLIRPLAVILVCFPIAAAAQSGLTYDLNLTEKIDGKSQASTGHVSVLGNNVRMDIVGKSSLGRISRTDLGDSIAIIKVGAHFDKVRGVLAELGLTDRAVIVEKATSEGERVMRLAEMSDGERPYFSTILVYKGGESW